MKKIIVLLMVAVSVCIGSYVSIIDGQYNYMDCNFDAEYDSSWWVFSFNGAFDTISGSKDTNHVNYQYIEDTDLDSIGVYYLKIYAFSSGSYADSSTHNIVQNIRATDGDGTEACTLKVTDSTDSPIEDATVYIYTESQSAIKVNGRDTDANGYLVCYLDSGYSYAVVIKENNYDYISDTITVTQDSLWAFEMELFSPGACNVYGWVWDQHLDTLGGNIYVTAYLVSDSTYISYNDNTIYPSSFRRKVKTNTSGYWTIPLIPNGYLSDTLSYYRIEFSDNRGWIEPMDSIYVPKQSSWQASR